MDLLSLVAQFIAFLLAFIVVVGVFILIQFFMPKRKEQGGDTRNIVGKDVKRFEKEEIPAKPVMPSVQRHVWEKYQPIRAFEVLYWRGVEEPWRWNSYTRDLVKYAQEHLPLRYVDFSMYNTSRKDPSYAAYKQRIEQLRLKKIRRFPLVVLTYLHGEEYISVDSTYAYQYVMDRIDAEWDRYYGLV